VQDQTNISPGGLKNQTKSCQFKIALKDITFVNKVCGAKKAKSLTSIKNRLSTDNFLGCGRQGSVLTIKDLAASLIPLES